MKGGEIKLQEFFTWNSLLTSSGATVATSVVTQLIKEAPPLKKIPTRLLSFGIALCILMLALIFDKSLSLGTAAISVINAAVVALAANGMFDAVSSGMGKPGSGQGGDSESAEPGLPGIADTSDGSTADTNAFAAHVDAPAAAEPSWEAHELYDSCGRCSKSCLDTAKISIFRKIFRILRI